MPTKGKGSHPISPPLPLPVHLTLLPSLLPNRALTPLLYVLVNEIPVYLTLSPTHPPYLSLLPLLLALLPTSPIHLIRQLPPTFSLDLDGVAPWEDLWVPLQATRALCEKLGVGRLFWDDHGSGLLGRGVDDAVSWEEEGLVCHNWIPSHAAIATSAYSLDTLLNTPFPGVEIISEDRYITTRLDTPRKAKILAQEFENPSIIREGMWQRAWPLLLRWSLAAWNDYLLYPSKPSRLKVPSDDQLSIIQPLLSILPSLANETFRPAYAPTLSDLSSLVLPMPPFTWSTIPRLIVSLFGYIWYILRSFVTLLNPWHRSPTDTPPTTLSFVELKRRELLARVNLSLAEIVGMVMVTIWTLSHELSKSQARGSGAPVIVLQTPLPLPAIARRRERSSKASPELGGSRGPAEPSEDELDVLERRRGGSPPRPVEPLPELKAPIESPAAFSGDEWDDASSSPSSVAAAQMSRMMRSEDAKEWWMYYTLIAITLAAIALGLAT